jgi:HSP20 family protein
MNTTTSTAVSRERSDPARRSEPAMLPPVDVIEDATGITLLADLPGVPRDEVHVRLESDTLTIEGEVKLPLPEGMDASHVEVQLPRYRRSFTLSKELDLTQVSADCSNGVLRLRIPKAQHAQPRRIEVKIN